MRRQQRAGNRRLSGGRSVVVAFEIVDITEDEGQWRFCPLTTFPFKFQLFVQRAAVRHAGQAIHRGQIVQCHFGQLLVRHVAQGFDDGDQLTMIIVNRTGVDGEVAAFADHRHDAPVLGVQAEAEWAGAGVRGIERVQLIMLFEGDDIGQAVALLAVKPAPVVAGADHFCRRDAGQSFAGVVPDGDAAVRVEHEGGYDKVLHQAHCKVVCTVAIARLMAR